MVHMAPWRLGPAGPRDPLAGLTAAPSQWRRAAVGAAIVLLPACSKPKREIDAGIAELVVLRAARTPERPPRAAVEPDTGAGGYDRHPRRPGDDDGHGYGYEFTDTFLHVACERFAECDVKSALASAERALYGCYDVAAVPGGRFVGIVTVHLTVSRRGQVDDSEVATSTTGSPEFDACVVESLRSAEFSRADDANDGDTRLTLELRITKAKP